MRLRMLFSLEKPKLNKDYRPAFISLLKNCFLKASTEVYKALYENGTTMKPFTFSVYLPNPKFEGDFIQLSSKEITLNFSTNESKFGVYFYNSLIQQRKRMESYPFPGQNSIQLKRVLLIKEKNIHSNEAVFKTLSPFLVRLHYKEDNRDEYLTPNHEHFIPHIQENIQSMIEKFTGLKEKIDFSPVKLNKVIPITHFGITVQGNTGIFKLSGSPQILELISKAGIGSRRSEGFGNLEILG